MAMSNKKKLIIGLAATIVVLLTVSLLPYINSTDQNSKNESKFSQPTDKNVSEDGYYVEAGFAEIAKDAKPAIENYAREDLLESANSRSSRLGKYFTADSPVYSKGTQYVNDKVKKTSAKLTALTGCADQEGENICSNATADVTFDYGNNKSTKPITYYLFIKKIDINQYKVVEIGPW